VEFKNKPGAPPELLLLNKDGQTVEKIDLAPLDQKGCNDLLISKGFFKKADESSEVPEEYASGPYVEVSKSADKNEL